MNNLPQDLMLKAQNDPEILTLLKSALENSKANYCDKAINNFSDLINKIPNIAELYLYRGLEYLELEDYQKAIDDFLKAVEINPSLDRAWLNLAGCRRHSGDIKGAYLAYCKGLEANPQNMHIYHNRAWIKYYLGDFEGAREDWLAASKLGHSESSKLANKIICKAILKMLKV
ncbi:MAG: tetratricopeptide repeat protein [Balneolaceae bacterium]|nr:tetratricopeptide repeat protein [Balneolaceae bacterium]